MVGKSSGGSRKSSGNSEVRELQEFLVSQGFNIAVDGIYGSETEAAYDAYLAYQSAVNDYEAAAQEKLAKDKRAAYIKSLSEY